MTGAELLQAIPIVNKIIDILGRWIPDKTEQIKAATEVVKAASEVQQAEMQGGWFGKNWRGITMLLLTGAILFRYTSDRMDLVTDLADQVIVAVWIIGLTGYQLTRDKVAMIRDLFKRQKQEPEK